MKNIFMVAVIIVLTAACQRSHLPASSVPFNQEVNNESGQIILIGKASLNVLQQPNYKPWFDQSFQNYIIDTQIIQGIRPLLKNKKIDIFLGSWCGDSKREVPRMLKIFENAGIDTTQISLIFLDNNSITYKQSPTHEEVGKNIHRVPTFIIKEGKKEIGRIVESPVVSLEKDMLSILQNTKYEPNYQAISYWIKQITNRNSQMSIEELQLVGKELKPYSRNYHEFNTYGYVQLATKNINEAINVFKLNTLLYPNEFGVFDSLGEAYAKMGNKKEAILAYEKVLSFQPKDTNAINALSKLKQ